MSEGIHLLLQLCVCVCGLVFVCLFVLFRATPTAYGYSQARSHQSYSCWAYTTATATWNPSPICDLYHSSWQHQILNPPIQASNPTSNHMVPSRIHFHCARTGTPAVFFNSSGKLKDKEKTLYFNHRRMTVNGTSTYRKLKIIEKKIF